MKTGFSVVSNMRPFHSQLLLHARIKDGLRISASGNHKNVNNYDKTRVIFIRIMQGDRATCAALAINQSNINLSVFSIHEDALTVMINANELA